MRPERLGSVIVLLSLLALTRAAALGQQSHSNQARGFNPSQVYDVHDLDSVNVFNGNMVLGVPVGGAYRVGGSLSYSLKLFYNSNLWSYSEVGPMGVNYNYSYMTMWVWPAAGGSQGSYKYVVWSHERFIPNDSQDPPRSSSGDSSYTVAFPNPNANAGLGWQMTLGNLFEPRAQEDSFDPQTTDQMLWVYQAPDGSEHQFYPTLHEDDPRAAGDEDPVTDPVTYTRDGTYLRMKVVDPTTRTIEFPDGAIHTLQNLAPPPQGGIKFSPYWTVTRMADRFGNAVTITYHITRDAQQRVVAVQWVIADGLRTNYVNLQRFEEAPEVGPVVRSVDLEGFNGQRSVYAFHYDVRTIRRAWPNVEDSPYINVDVTVPFLKYVEQPDDSRYSMEPVDDYYDVTGAYSNTRYRGVLRKLTLPTGARLEWEYKPKTPPTDLYNSGYVYPMMSTGRNYLRRNYGGVRVRRLVEGGNAYEWLYDPQLEPQPSGCTSSSADAPCAHKVFKSRVTTPQGDYTWHYFSVYPFPRDSDAGRQPSDWHVAEYGLPLRKDVSQTAEDGTPVFLSSEVYNSAGTKLRETYVRYETDKLTQRDPWGAVVANDRRLVASKTLYLDDAEFGVKYAEEKYSEFDGLGHLRRRETEGNFAAADYRMEKTNYNHARGTYLVDPVTNQTAPGHTYTPFPESSPWVLGTYNFTLQREGGSTAMQQYNFNGSGQLRRKRVLRNNGGAGTPSPAASDVLTVYGYDAADGTLTSEDYYGGDRQNNVGHDAITGALPASSEYRVNRTYQHKELKTSQYRGANFYTYDADVDQSTGLVKRSRDASKFPTEYTYDAMGRLTVIRPAAGSRTEIQYEPVTGGATGGTPKATIRHKTNDGAAVLDQEGYEYDNLGRVKVEKKMMPGGSFIARQTLYNGMGWVTSVSEWQAWTDGMTAFAHKTLYSQYDPFGRARLVTPADGAGHAVSFDYRGVREVKTTRNVASGLSGGVPTESPVVGYEGYDRQGRFGSVSERSGPAGGELVKTTYLYDVGGRLKQAVTDAGAPPPPAPSYRGSHDLADCNVIAGWAQDANSPSTRLSVSVYDEASGALVATAPANLFRQDLLNAGIGDGRHGFSVPTPAALKDGRGRSLRVKVTGAEFSLGGTPKVFNSATAGCTNPTLSGSEYVWVEDAAPAGAALYGSGESWAWVGAAPAPHSGASAHQSALASGMHQHYFDGATQAMTVGAGDRLFSYVYLDPANPPTQVMLQWNDGTWDHRAYWGANQIGWGTNGTNSRRYMGPLPSAGGWVRLEVAASQVGLEGRTVKGMAFTLYNGKATWDRAGRYGSSAGMSAGSAQDEEPAAATEESAGESAGMEDSTATEEPPLMEGQAATAGASLTQTRVFNYDNRAFLNSEQLPEVGASGNGTIGYAMYDSMGRVGSKRDGTNKLRYDYDAAGRLTTLRECLTEFTQCDAPGNSRPVKEYTFYNADQSASGVYELGKLSQATRHNYLLDPYASPATPADVTVTESYQYRATGALLSRRQTDTSTGVGFSQTFAYNGLGQMTSQGYPQCSTGHCAGVGPQRAVGYTYDRGELTGVTGYAQNIQYHPHGLVSRAERLNHSGQVAVTETHDKDPNNIRRPRRVTLSGGVSWTTGDYKYDGSGNIKAIGSDWYVYDGAGRLVEGTALNTANAAEKKKQTYQYDPFGNITQKEDYAYVGTASQTRTGLSRPEVMSGTNRLGGIPYDASGNATGESSSAGVYQYDALNMMKAAPGKLYIYTADDERVWVLDHSAGTPFHYLNTFTLRGKGNEVLREYTQVGYNTSAGAWAWVKDYVHAPAGLLASESASGRLNYHTDHLGTPRVLTNASGAAVSKHNYLPFGEEATNPAQDYERLKFTGHERETNYYPGQPMDYMHARYYRYAQGKFMGVDPGRDYDLKRPQSWNLYAYARNNPISNTDPTGRNVVGSVLSFLSKMGIQHSPAEVEQPEPQEVIPEACRLMNPLTYDYGFTSEPANQAGHLRTDSEGEGQFWSNRGTGGYSHPHGALDLAGVDGQTIVRPIAPGTIEAVGEQKYLGNFVRIRHGDWLTSTYGHLEPGSTPKWMKRGVSVGTWARIGRVGTSGNGGVPVPHLHLITYVSGQRVNPAWLMNSNMCHWSNAARSMN